VSVAKENTFFPLRSSFLLRSIVHTRRCLRLQRTHATLYIYTYIYIKRKLRCHSVFKQQTKENTFSFSEAVVNTATTTKTHSCCHSVTVTKQNTFYAPHTNVFSSCAPAAHTLRMRVRVRACVRVCVCVCACVCVCMICLFFSCTISSLRLCV